MTRRGARERPESAVARGEGEIARRWRAPGKANFWSHEGLSEFLTTLVCSLCSPPEGFGSRT